MAYFRGVAGEVRERLAALGARSLDEIVGAVERLRPRNESASRGLPRCCSRHPSAAQQSEKICAVEIHAARNRVDIRRKLATRRRIGLKAFRASCTTPSPSANSDRSVGAHLSGHILRRTNFDGLNGKMHSTANFAAPPDKASAHFWFRAFASVWWAKPTITWAKA